MPEMSEAQRIFEEQNPYAAQARMTRNEALATLALAFETHVHAVNGS